MSVPKVHLGALILALLATSCRLWAPQSAAAGDGDGDGEETHPGDPEPKASRREASGSFEQNETRPPEHGD